MCPMALGGRGPGGDTMRVHDYLYDSTFLVSGARDYARAAFKAAMASAQVNIQPLYKTMFSELITAPRTKVVFHPNCRLPEHLDRSYQAYLSRVEADRNHPVPELAGKDRYRFIARPKKVLDINTVSPEFHPPSPGVHAVDGRPKNKGTQSRYRESSAQTTPWQPPGKKAPDCETTPEVLYLDALEWGPGKPYRLGDLPADFHTTEIINKMRHARTWTAVVENSGRNPRWMKRREDIISDVETRDWIFREAEIDELQDIRLELLHKLQRCTRSKQNAKMSRKLSHIWAEKKAEVERRVGIIRRTRDRELRKLKMAHEYGRSGLKDRRAGARGGGSVTYTAADLTSDMHAPLLRHGYQARRKHAEIYYDPSLLAHEDHEKLSKPPAWLEQCGQNLRKTCSGHHLPRDPTQLCERETKWSEAFLTKLHNDLKMSRTGGSTPGPLRILKPRRVNATPRPSTPEVEGVMDNAELCHQAALTLQKIIRGRAVQCLMYEGRTRASELTAELKTTHGLQKEDKIHIAKEEAKSRDYHVLQSQAEREDSAVAALVDELCGSTVSAALDFLEKELRRLREERRHHAFMLIAVREKVMREAAEAGRRQKAEQRRKEHDDMFKQIVGVTQETVEAYLHDVIVEGVQLEAEEEAVRRAQRAADDTERQLKENESMSTAEQHELVAELVHQFLLPEAHKCASRRRTASLQHARTEAARKAIFQLLDESEIKEELCTRCGLFMGDDCRCHSKAKMEPKETVHRHDPRWQHTIPEKVVKKEKSTAERFPPWHQARALLDAVVDDAVAEAKRRAKDRCYVRHTYAQELKERLEFELEISDLLNLVIDQATGAVEVPVKARGDYGYTMMHIRHDALERTDTTRPLSVIDQATGAVEVPVKARGDYGYTMMHIRHDALERTDTTRPLSAPTELPSEIRARELAETLRLDPRCYCIDASATSVASAESEPMPLLPSQLRELEELRRCKCGMPTPPPSRQPDSPDNTTSTGEKESDADSEDSTTVD